MDASSQPVGLTCNTNDEFESTKFYKDFSYEKIQWRMAFQSKPIFPSDKFQMRVTAQRDNSSNLWTINADLTIFIKKTDGNEKSRTITHKFTPESKTVIIDLDEWANIKLKENNYLDSTGLFTVVLKIDIKGSVGINRKRKFSFDRPQENVRDSPIIVSGKKLYVSKSILALNSQPLYTLFFGNFTEATQNEVKIEEDWKKFLPFLEMMHTVSITIDSLNVQGLLEMADKYDVSFISAKCENFLKYTKTVSVLDKLILSESYNLSELQTTALNSLKTTKDVLALTKESGKLGKLTLQALFKKMGDMMSSRSCHSHHSH